MVDAAAGHAAAALPPILSNVSGELDDTRNTGNLRPHHLLCAGRIQFFSGSNRCSTKPIRKRPRTGDGPPGHKRKPVVDYGRSHQASGAEENLHDRCGNYPGLPFLPLRSQSAIRKNHSLEVDGSRYGNGQKNRKSRLFAEQFLYFHQQNQRQQLSGLPSRLGDGYRGHQLPGLPRPGNHQLGRGVR